MPQQPLHWPRCAIAERADGVALDLGGDVPQETDLTLMRTTLGHAREHAPHPSHALAAWPVQGLLRHFRPEIEKRIDQYTANADSVGVLDPAVTEAAE